MFDVFLIVSVAFVLVLLLARSLNKTYMLKKEGDMQSKKSDKTKNSSPSKNKGKSKQDAIVIPGPTQVENVAPDGTKEPPPINTWKF